MQLLNGVCLCCRFSYRRQRLKIETSACDVDSQGCCRMKRRGPVIDPSGTKPTTEMKDESATR